MTITSTVAENYLNFRVSATNGNFDTIFSITDPNVLIKALKTAALFQQALVPAQGDSLRFDVQKALELVKADPDLSVTNFTDITKETSNSATAVMTELVLQTIKTVLGIALAAEPAKQLQAAIEGAYVGLNERKDDAWIFWERRSAHKTTYQYNITFSVEAGPTGLLLMTCPMGLTIEVNQEYERVLFITLRDSESYSCRIQALTTAQIAKPLTRSADVVAAHELLGQLTANGIVEVV
jgi:uncharacterized protein (DUF2267 family)